MAHTYSTRVIKSTTGNIQNDSSCGGGGGGGATARGNGGGTQWQRPWGTNGGNWGGGGGGGWFGGGGGVQGGTKSDGGAHANTSNGGGGGGSSYVRYDVKPLTAGMLSSRVFTGDANTVGFTTPIYRYDQRYVESNQRYVGNSSIGIIDIRGTANTTAACGLRGFAFIIYLGPDDPAGIDTKYTHGTWPYGDALD
jgi:hypothetical protein